MTDQEIVAGRGDIAQASGTLGLNIYADFKYRDVLQTFFSTANVGQGSGAVAWLTGSLFGGDDVIAQLWDNNGSLALNIYGGVFDKALFSFSNLGQGSGAVAWLTGNFISSGTTEIAQLWDNGGNLSCLLYTFAGGTVQGDPFTGGLGQGPGALAWLTGNFTGSGLTSIAQPWAS